MRLRFHSYTQYLIEEQNEQVQQARLFILVTSKDHSTKLNNELQNYNNTET